MSILIQDSIGNTWSISANSLGNITTVPSSGTALPVLFLRDTSNQVWQVGINSLGELTTTPGSPLDTPQFTTISLGSTPNWNMFINVFGMLQTGRGGAFGAWQPNGFGAGTDNSVAGGGGGFMAIPQPPTGPKATTVPLVPENYGQFGATQIAYNNGIGTYFSVSNPGRSVNS